VERTTSTNAAAPGYVAGESTCNSASDHRDSSDNVTRPLAAPPSFATRGRASNTTTGVICTEINLTASSVDANDRSSDRVSESRVYRHQKLSGAVWKSQELSKAVKSSLKLSGVV